MFEDGWGTADFTGRSFIIMYLGLYHVKGFIQQASLDNYLYQIIATTAGCLLLDLTVLWQNPDPDR